jgi:hypothetical protein
LERGARGSLLLGHTALVVADAWSARRYPCAVDRDEILRVFRAFEASGLEYVLIGATAVGFHGVVRVTEDLDLFSRRAPRALQLEG